MNWSRLGRAVVSSILISFVLGAMVSPPDPISQILSAGPLFLVLVPLTYRFGPGVWGAVSRGR